MNTYETYQEAKIANPNQEIYELSGKFQTGDAPARPGEKWELCNPADYCISLSDFRELDYEVCNGDLILGIDGTFVEVSNVYNYNKPWHGDDKRFILKAKALEETKTYRYEKVTDSIFGLKEEFERGELFSFDGDEHYVQIETEGDFSYAHVHESLYRRIEVTERELEIEAMTARLWGRDIDRDVRKLAAKLHSLGFKLVNGKG